MTDVGSDMVRGPKGRAQRAARRPGRRARALLVGTALLVVCGVVRGHAGPSPIVRIVIVGGDPEQSLTLDDRTSRAFVFNRRDNTVSVLDAATGALLRTVTAGASFVFMAVDRPTGRVFVGSGGDGTISMLGAWTGQVLRTVSDPDSNVRQLAVDERTNRVFVGGNSNALTVLDGRTGALLHRFPVPGNANAVAVDSQTGHVLVDSVGRLDKDGFSTTTGTVRILDVTTGRVLRTVPVGMEPTDIAIDTLHRRAVVVNSDSDVNGNGTGIAWRPRESWWPQVLRRVKQVICCLPFQAPPPPGPTTNGTVTTIDLSGM